MKRPKVIFLIIALCFIVTGPYFRRFEKMVGEKIQVAAEQPPAWLALISVVGLILLLWLLAGLSQLRPRACWIAVGILGLDVIARIVFFQVAIQTGVKWPAPVLFVIFDLAAIWYLTRPSFRDFAKNYSAEQDREKSAKEMQKLSLKKISKGLWN